MNTGIIAHLNIQKQLLLQIQYLPIKQKNLEMDIPQQRYKKIISIFRPYFNYVIWEYPIPEQLHLDHQRNLKYIIEKQKYANGFCADSYSELIQEIKNLINSRNIENRLFAAKLIRIMPFYYRLRAIEDVGNDISIFMQRQGSISTTASTARLSSNNMSANSTKQNTTLQYHYESVADTCDLLLSVYQISALSEDIYFDVNQKVISIFSRIVENCLSNDRNLVRNSYEALRSIFMVFGECKNWKKALSMISQMNVQNMSNFSEEETLMGLISSQTMGNKLINKIISIFGSQSYYIPSASQGFSSLQNCISPTFTHFRQLILKTREYQIRIRCRMLTSISFIVTYIPEQLHQIYELLASQVFIILENAHEFDINFQCFYSIKALLSLPLSPNLRTKILKKWIQILSEISCKKQYYEFYVRILKEVSEYAHCPLKIRFYVSINYLKITNLIIQQFSRFIIYKFACRNIMGITDQSRKKTKQIQDSTHKKFNQEPVMENNLIFQVFQYKWFVDRIKQDNDLFKSQFLICLLHSYFISPNKVTATNQTMHDKREIKDLMFLCHRLLDWKCSCKEDTHIPTIKFAFDLYLQFLKSAAEVLGNEIQEVLVQLIERCNEPDMYLLFKLKLISTFIRIPNYSEHIINFSEKKLDLSFIEGQIHPFMMPKNSKPIFEYEYSLEVDGQIESRKQIETIKVIMSLLHAILEVHKEKKQVVTEMIINYHLYLDRLEEQPNSNKDLISCLKKSEADHYFNESQRNFLLSLIDETDHRGNNIQLTLDQKIVYSPMEIYDRDEEYNIFGNMSPVHLKIRVIGSSGYDTVYIEIKKNNWASVSDMILVISSAVEIKEVPFESGIVEIKIDRMGLLNFEAWTVDQPKLMLGSGSHKIKFKHVWMRLDHLKFIDGISSKAFLSNPSQISENRVYSEDFSSQVSQVKTMSEFEQPKTSQVKKAGLDSCYLTFCFGEPILIQLIYSRNQIMVTVSNREIWIEVQSLIVDMVNQLTEESALIL